MERLWGEKQENVLLHVLRVTIAVIKCNDQKHLEKKSLFGSHDPSHTQSIEGNQGRNSKPSRSWRQGLTQRPWRSCCRLTYSPWLCSACFFFFFFFKQNSGPIVQGCPPTIDWTLPTSLQSRTYTTGWPAHSLVLWSILSIAGPSSLMTLACLKLTQIQPVLYCQAFCISKFGLHQLI